MIKENKITYEAPTLEVIYVEMEQGIAAGSAIVHPGNSAGEIKEEWQVDPNDDRTLDW